MNRSAFAPTLTGRASGVMLTLSVLLGSLLGSVPAAAQQEEQELSVDFSIGKWFLKAEDMDILMSDTVGSGPVLGQRLDFPDTFGTDDGTKAFVSLKVLLGYRDAIFIRGGYQKIRFSGGGVVNGPGDFAGYTLDPGSPTDTSTRFDFFEVGLQWNIIRSNELKLGLLVEPKIMNFRVRVDAFGQRGVSGPPVPFYEKEEEVLLIPLAGLTAELRPFDWLALRGEVKAMRLTSAGWLPGLDGDLTSYDWEVDLSFHFGDSVAITGGYRATKFDMELAESGVRKTKADLKFSGWYASLDLRF